METTVQLNHLVIGLLGFGTLCASLFAIWRLFDRIRQPVTKLEEDNEKFRKFVYEKMNDIDARIADNRKDVESVLHVIDEAKSIKTAITRRIDEMLTKIQDFKTEVTKEFGDLKLKMSDDHGSLSERLTALENSGCDPIKRERTK